MSRLLYCITATAALMMIITCVNGISLPPQKFAIEPVDRTAIVGATVILPCRVDNKVGTLQWTRDGFGLGSDRELPGFPRYEMHGSDEEGDLSLQISNVNLEDDAVFQCQVGAAEGVKGIRSRSSTLTVFVPPNPPKIVQGDKTLRTTAGMTIELTCESHAGKPPAELTWLDGDGNPVTSGTEYTTKLLPDGKKSNAMLKWTFAATQDMDGKNLTCRAENPALDKPLRTSIRIEVKFAPQITLTVDKDSVSEYDDVAFECNAVANPGQMVFKWYKNDEIIMGDHTTHLRLSKVTRELNGAVISCEVSNSVGTSRASHTMSVNFGPVFKTPMDTVYAAEIGQEVRLKCDVEGNPAPEIIWLYEGSPRVLSTQKELLITDMSQEKVGKYICRASVAGFPEISASSLVFIKGPPRIRSSAVQYGSEGELVRVECLIQSIPAPSKILWSHNSQSFEVDNNQGYEIVEEILPGDSLVRNTLLIRKTKRDDFGVYNCSVWNQFGFDSMLITLAQQKTFPVLLIVGGLIGTVVIIVSITIVVILCMKRKSTGSSSMDDFMNEIKLKANGNAGSNMSTTDNNSTSAITKSSGQYHQHIDSGSSGESDMKVEIRTSSSLSDQHHPNGLVVGNQHVGWEMDYTDSHQPHHDQVTANEIAQVVENIYNYTAAANTASTDPIFPKEANGNGNGYIQYVDYNRDYLPPPPAGQQAAYALAQGTYAPVSHASVILATRDSYVDPMSQHYGTLTIDPRYRAGYGNPYLRNTSNLTMSNQQMQQQQQQQLSQQQAAMLSSPNHHQNLTMGSQASPNASLYSQNQRYITSPQANQVKPGTLATHV